MAAIRVTPEELNTQGQALIGYAGDIRDLLAQIDAKINEIIDGWDGLAQDSYFNMYETMKESLNQFPELVDSLGNATTGAADAFAQVDEGLQSSFNGAM